MEKNARYYYDLAKSDNSKLDYCLQEIINIGDPAYLVIMAREFESLSKELIFNEVIKANNPIYIIEWALKYRDADRNMLVDAICKCTPKQNIWLVKFAGVVEGLDDSHVEKITKELISRKDVECLKKLSKVKFAPIDDIYIAIDKILQDNITAFDDVAEIYPYDPTENLDSFD
ncbi:MAG: hypothetical protein E7351_01920 [Clostridiales bacterium]|nr:hypothetical protein [Clostridiales bacterium]